MQESITQSHLRGTISAATWPSNDNRRAPLVGGALFPQDAVARIYRPCRSVTTSGRARTKGWRLAFERRSAPFIERLMGWTGGHDTLVQVELSFPTLESAVRYAERQGLRYAIQPAGAVGAGDEAAVHETASAIHRVTRSARAFSDATLKKLGLEALQERYGDAMNGAADRNDPAGPETWASPMEVVQEPALPLDAKRSILMGWAYTEYLIDQATNEGMPENDRPSRLDEVEQALLALERMVAGERPLPVLKAA